MSAPPRGTLQDKRMARQSRSEAKRRQREERKAAKRARRLAAPGRVHLGAATEVRVDRRAP
jgi:hypothetical protein